MAETNSLLNCRIQQWVPGVRIPPSPRKKEDDGEWVFLARNGWHLNKTAEDFPKIKLLETRQNA